MTRPTKLGLVGFGIVIVVALFFSLRGPMVKLPALAPASTPVTQGKALPVLGPNMPAFSGITRWWNTPGEAALSPESLKGKVALVDFWTYSCINCLRTLPFVKALYAKYSPSGFTIVGVHTPEFTFEADPANVNMAIAQNGISYPVALDPNYSTWNAYGNEYWPAEYLFDAQGRLRYTNFSEGNYDETEQAVRSLLAEASSAALPAVGVPDTTPDFSLIKTPETYFGLERGTAFMGTPGVAGQDAALTAAAAPAPDQWTAGGTWRFFPQYIETETANNVFRFSVQASKLHLVMSSSDGNDKTIDVFVDGKAAGTVTVNAAELYTPATFPDAKRHTVELRIHDAKLQIYSATFS